MANKRLMAACLTGAGVLPLLLPAAVFAQDLPRDPHVVAGDVRISNPSDTALLLQQSSQYGIVDWGAFSIGQGYGVQVNNGSGTTLNRVTGGDMSSILGNLTATGSVYLVNPNGIVVGRSGLVNTGGRFVASTLDMTNADLLNGGDATFAGSSDAYVINLGKVSSLGGDVGLLARTVVNEGTLSAPNGTVGVIAGREILMRDASVADGLFSVKVGGSDTSATDAGAIAAAAAELRAKGGNVYALAGNTQGTIEATGVAKVKGRIFLTAGDSGTLTVEKPVKAKAANGNGGAITATGGRVDMAGTLDASGTQGGSVVVKAGGETRFDGQITATGGTGGFVELSGGHLAFDGTVRTGGGTLLIDPDNIEIASPDNEKLGGNIDPVTVLTPNQVQTLLGSGNVVIRALGTSHEAGTLAVTDGVTWSNGNSLTFMATGDVLFYASVQNDGASGGDLNVVAGWDGATGAGSFDAAPFDAADLTNPLVFGQGNGTAYTYDFNAATAAGTVVIGSATSGTGIAVGSKTGTTRVYAQDLMIVGATSGGGGYAELGYNVTGFGDQGTVSGAIKVRVSHDINLIAGNGFDDAAQIGHFGINPSISVAATATATGDISVEAGHDMLLQGGTTADASMAYAMVGNGAYGSHQGGSRSGNIKVTVGNDLVLEQGNISFSNAAWIGHWGSGAFAKADTTLTAGAFFGSLADQGTNDPSLSLDMLALDTGYGDVRATTTNSGLTLAGSTSGLACECDHISTAGNLIVETSADLTLGQPDLSDFFYSNVGGGGLVLASGGNVINNAGAGAFGSGQWLIYSDRPDHDVNTVNVLPSNMLFFDTNYNPDDPFDPSQLEGNVMVYRKAPVVVVADATLTYGQTYAPPDGAVTMEVFGTLEPITDPSTWGFFISSPFVDDAVAPNNSDGFVDVGPHVDALDVNFTAGTSGVVSSFFLGRGDLTVVPVNPPVQPVLVTRAIDPFPTTPLGNPTGPTDVLQVIDTETTQQILDEINAGANFCREFVQEEYAVDCLSDRLQSVADGLSSTGEYSEVKAALEDAARKLHQLAIDNASTELAQAVARSTSGPLRTSSRPLTAISSDQLLTVNAEARAIIASTEVVLLRSGADSARRRVAFQQVGQIVGSTATLLRSS